MRKLAIGIMTAGTLMTAAPAMAQVYIDGPGVDVRLGDRGDRWDRGNHYGWDRGYHRGWNSYARGCRTVTVRERTSDGRVIVRTRERC